MSVLLSQYFLASTWDLGVPLPLLVSMRPVLPTSCAKLRRQSGFRGLKAGTPTPGAFLKGRCQCTRLERCMDIAWCPFQGQHLKDCMIDGSLMKVLFDKVIKASHQGSWRRESLEIVSSSINSLMYSRKSITEPLPISQEGHCKASKMAAMGLICLMHWHHHYDVPQSVDCMVINAFIAYKTHQNISVQTWCWELGAILRVTLMADQMGCQKCSDWYYWHDSQHSYHVWRWKTIHQLSHIMTPYRKLEVALHCFSISMYKLLVLLHITGREAVWSWVFHLHLDQIWVTFVGGVASAAMGDHYGNNTPSRFHAGCLQQEVPWY